MLFKEIALSYKSEANTFLTGAIRKLILYITSKNNFP